MEQEKSSIRRGVRSKRSKSGTLRRRSSAGHRIAG
jgi:hypothetical protein